MNNRVISKVKRVDVDVSTEPGTGRPHISIKMPREFYSWSQQRQGEVFVESARIAFEKFGEHLLAMRKAGG